MKVTTEFEKNFSEEKLNAIFKENVLLTNACGIDNIRPRNVRTKIDNDIRIILNKVPKSNYEFTKYKLKLITKGRKKAPRELSIPTVRDRIVLRALCDFLTSRFESSLNLTLPQTTVRHIKRDLENGSFNTYIKLDVRNFYPSINHDQMLKRLRKRIHHPHILNLIKLSIQTPTVSVSKPWDKPSEEGVPQGLSISNILANIYLVNIDRHLRGIPYIRYYRFVDDILILCDGARADEIVSDVIKRFKRLKLNIYDPRDKKSSGKSGMGEISNSFKYLGYEFEGVKTSVRQESIDKLKSSLASIFTSHKYSKKKNEQFLRWRINLRITGCVFQEKSKGWLHFFSEINDEELLHKLDHFVKILIKRFDVKIKPKKFVRTYYELKCRRYETSYIPNFDKFDLAQKKHVLKYCFGLNLIGWSDKKIEYEFLKRISRQVKDLEEDIRSIYWY